MLKRSSLLLLLLLVSGLMPAQDLIPSQWPHLKGYWKFQDVNKLTKASVGNDLSLVGTHQQVAGPSFNDTAVRISIGSYYKCHHNMAPNGGGDSVNQYTLMFDFKILSLKKWHTFFQTDTTNTNDGECFIRPTNSATPGAIGVGSTGYSTETVVPNKWYRLMISINPGSHFRYYLNGKLIHEGDTQDIDDRFALNPHFLLFADDNQEDDTIDIASVAVFDTCLSATDIARIGTIDPCVLHPLSLSLGNDTTICGSNTLSKSLGYGKFSYKWSTGDTSANLVFSIKKLSTGLKTIWVNKTDINQCSLSDTFLLGIYNPPIVNLGNDTSFCQGQKLKLTAGSASGNSFVWKKMPSGTIVSKLNNLTIDSSGLFVVNMNNQFGCSDMDSIQVTVFPTPAKPIVKVSKLDICLGDTAIVSSTVPYKRYLWNTGDTSASIRVSSSKTLFLATWDIHGCSSASSDSVQVKMHLPPARPELKYLTDTTFCSGDSSILSVAGSFSSYTWNDGPGDAYRIIKTAGAYDVFVKDQYGCRSQTSNVINIRINPNPDRPIIDIIGPSILCDGDSVILQSKDPATTYIWNNAPGNRSLIIKSNGLFRLRVKNIHNCLSQLSDTTTINFIARPAKPFIKSLGKDSITCHLPAQKYQWSQNGSSLPDSMRSLKAVNKSYYFVKVNDDGCWSESSDSFYFEKSSINSTKITRLVLRISPNPARDLVKFQMVNLVDNGIAAVRIMDIAGREVLDMSTMADNIARGLTLDLGALQAGVYTVRVSTRLGVYIARFVLE